MIYNRFFVFHFIAWTYYLSSFAINAYAQTNELNLTINVFENNCCNCIDSLNLNNARISINEVCFYSLDGDGDFIYGSEWIELYNSNSTGVDISNYIFSILQPNGYGTGGGTYFFPTGTTIPPVGYCILRGQNAPGVDSLLLFQNGGSCVEVVVDECNLCYDRRFFMANICSAVVLYDSIGIVQDAVGWKTDMLEEGIHPCIPNGSQFSFILGDSLVSFDEISPDLKCEAITSLFPYINIQQRGKTLARLYDGGPWGIDTFFLPTYGFSNNVAIMPPYSSFNEMCNGVAILNPSGGIPPYSYHCAAGCLHGDTLLHLCEGLYTVMVVDNSNDTIIETFYVPNRQYSDTVVFEVAESELPFVWGDFFFENADTISEFFYDSQGCDSVITFCILITYDDYDNNTLPPQIDPLLSPLIDVYVPNAFTPNGDGQNDLFLPVFNHPERLENYSLHIYDRWGRLLFSTDNPHQGWNCSECPAGVYVWRMEYKAAGEGSKILTGSVTVVR
jgi:gliding motility-associated-like protein